MSDSSAPNFNEAIDPAPASREALDLLLRRRSVKAIDLGAPGPTPAQRLQLLTIAARVPDHGKLAPWRFILFEGDARTAFGEILAKRFAETEPACDEVRCTFERDRFLRAPLVIAVISSPKESAKIPDWEQILSSGAVCQNLLIAAAAMGFAAQWITEWYGYDRETTAALGLIKKERVAGFVYIGTALEAPKERKRPELDELVLHWGADLA